MPSCQYREGIFGGCSSAEVGATAGPCDVEMGKEEWRQAYHDTPAASFRLWLSV